MLSICIPVYNVDVRQLVLQLYEQCLSSSSAFEIIIQDDASDPKYRALNTELDAREDIHYHQLHTNIGRAQIRNAFLPLAQYDYMLFMDCDSEVPDNEFIKRYFQSIESNQDVVCGGRIYYDEKPERPYHLRWKYGLERELGYEDRGFMSNNFLIRKEILSQIRFDEHIKKYGHEDTLFGYRLKKAGIEVMHIQNPLLHNKIESNAEFLNKSERALENLFMISAMSDVEDDLEEEVSLLKVYNKLKRNGAATILSWTYSPMKYILKPILKYSRSNLFLFDLYRLLYFCYISRQSQ